LRALYIGSLPHLHVGHSNVNDPLHATILLSHLAPLLETPKWFHEKNRPGYAVPVDRMVQIKPGLLSVFVDATPEVALRCVGVEYMMVDTRSTLRYPPCSSSSTTRPERAGAMVL